jgi:hypothetical protein
VASGTSTISIPFSSIFFLSLLAAVNVIISSIGAFFVAFFLFTGISITCSGAIVIPFLKKVLKDKNSFSEQSYLFKIE